MGKWCLHASSFILDRIIIKVAGNQDMHKSLDEFDFTWPIYMFFEMRFDLGTLDSGERSLPFGLLVLNLQRMSSDKGFLFTSTFVPKGLSAPALGLYTCIKALKYIPGPGDRTTGPLVTVVFLYRVLKGYMVQFTGTFSGSQKEMQDLAKKHGANIGRFI